MTLRITGKGPAKWQHVNCLKPNTKLIVTILPKHDAERESWLRLSGKGLESAYGEDEEEYTVESVKEPNLEYKNYVNPNKAKTTICHLHSD